MLLRTEPHRLDIPVEPLVVVWPNRSGNVQELPDRVVFGDKLKDFCARLESDRLDSNSVTLAAHAIANFVRRRDDYEFRPQQLGSLRKRWYSFRFEPLRK